MRIDGYFDIVCPFSFLAKRNLDRALADHPGLAVEVRLHPHMLYPHIPLESHHFRAFFVGRYGEELRVPMWERVTEMGRRVGIAFNFHGISKGPHSIHAHRLVAFAAREGKQSAVLNAVYSAFFEQGRDVGDHEVLAAIAADQGLDAEAVRRFLAGRDLFAEIFEATYRQSAAGINAMPTHFLDGRRLSGEAEPGTFDRLFRAAGTARLAG